MNYTNAFDDEEDNLQLGGLDLNNRPEPVYDGRRQRKQITRRYADHNQAFILYKQHLPFNNYVQYPQNIPDQFRFLEPAFVYTSLATSLTSKFIRAATNKVVKSAENAMAWQPDGKRLVTGSQSGVVTLWDSDGFHYERSLQRRDLNSSIFELIWSHSGDYMLTVDQSNRLKVWRANYDVIEQWRIHADNNFVRQLCFSPSDRKFASCSDDTTVKIWDLSTRSEERTIENGINVYTVDWHPCRSLIASGTKDGAIRFADPRTGTSLSKMNLHKNAVMKVQWNQNGFWILSCGRDSTVRLIDTRMMSEVMTFQGHEKDVYTIAWHPTQPDLFVSGGYTGEMHWWSIGNERPVYSLTNAHSQAINQLRYHPLGHILASTGKEGMVKFWVRNRAGDDVTKSSNETNMEHAVLQNDSNQIDIPGLPTYQTIFPDQAVPQTNKDVTDQTTNLQQNEEEDEEEEYNNFNQQHQY